MSIKRLFLRFNVKKELFEFKSEPLSFLSILLLIILDIFLLVAIIDGINTERQKNPPPSIFYPTECTKYFKYDYKNYSDFYTINNQDIALVCILLDDSLNALVSSDEFDGNLSLLNFLKKDLRDIDDRLNVIRKNYNTKLFEKIANETGEQELYKIKVEYNYLQDEQARIKREIDEIPSLDSNIYYQNYKSFISQNKDRFEKEFKEYSFYQPFYEFFRLLAFVTPLLVLFGFLYLKVKYDVIRLLSAHIIMLLILPLLFNILYLIYSILPKTFLKSIIDFFSDLGLVSIFEYIVIALVMFLFGIAIYFIQKRVAAKRLYQSKNDIKKRISLSLCAKCGFRVDYSKNYCPHCANSLKRVCNNCGNSTIGELPFCEYCGEEYIN